MAEETTLLALVTLIFLPKASSALVNREGMLVCRKIALACVIWGNSCIFWQYRGKKCNFKCWETEREGSVAFFYISKIKQQL